MTKEEALAALKETRHLTRELADALQHPLTDYEWTRLEQLQARPQSEGGAYRHNKIIDLIIKRLEERDDN